MRFRVFIVVLLALIVIVACQQTQPTVTIEEEPTLFTDIDIDNAVLQVSNEVEVIPVVVEGVIPDGEVITTDSNGEEDSLTTLLDANNLSGYVCNIINNTNGRNKWRIQSINAADESVIGLFAVKQDGRAMQSIGCNAQGNKAVFAMKTSSSADYEVFLLDYTGSTRQAYQLTSNTKNDIDVSMSADGSVVVWQSWIGSDKVITVRQYAPDGTFIDTVLDGSVPYVEPSVNSEGTYVAFIDIQSSQTNLLKYDLATSTTTVAYTTSGKRSLAHPSISNDGNRVAWMEGADDENFKVKDLSTNTITEIVTNNPNLEHGFLADDGNSVVYSINRDDKAFTKVKNVDDGTTKNVGRVLNPPARYRGSSWVKQAQTCSNNTRIVGTQNITTQSQVNSLSDVSKINGDLILNPSSNLDFSPLGLLQEVTGTFELVHTANQTILTGFDCLSNIGGDFDLSPAFGTSNNTLVSISGFDALNSIGGDFSIGRNAVLTSVFGFSMLSSIGEDLFIVSNSSLTDIPEFPALSTINEDFFIYDNFDLVSISGFDALTSISNQLTISNHQKLESVSGFSILSSVGEAFNITNNNNLESIPTFNFLFSIGDSFSFTNNDEFDNLTGFASLSYIDRDLRISDNLFLDSISGFDALNSVGGMLSITDNFTLVSLTGMGQLLLENIGTLAWIFDNPAFNCLDNLPSFAPIHSSFDNAVDCPTIN